jgi:hypothetical protein
LIGAGLGIMLTPSVNVVQSAFPENLQGEISGLSRSVSNLESSPRPDELHFTDTAETTEDA